ncbi:MAG TPA: tetratricopeptide repeat protein [Pirellulales bacterium]|nr:tetratricopeptide repeat protein [Pirellulales bacterium]
MIRFQSRFHCVRDIVAFTVLSCCALFLPGCGPASPPSSSGSPSSSNTTSSYNGQVQYRNDLLISAVGLLNSPEQFDDDAQNAAQLVERFNQWRRLAKGAEPNAKQSDSASAPAGENEQTSAPNPQDSLLATLPDNLLKTHFVRHLNDEPFDPAYDGNFLREAALLRDVANSIEPDKLDDVSVAQALFDWTVRNIQSEPPPLADDPPNQQWPALHLPVETVYFGAGTPLQRAWVFMLLARQRGLDVVLLATPDPRSPNQFRPWVTALVSEGELYLFDPTYGLPIPGPGGQGVATLSQAAADDAVLRQMDIPGDRIYPRKAADLQKVTALLEASPGYLEPRMKMLESHLTGHDRLVLSASPADLAEKLRGIKHVDQIKLWPQPYEVLEQRRSLPPPLQLAQRLEYMPFAIPADPEQAKHQSDSEEPQRPQRTVLPLRLGRLLQLRGLLGGSDRQRPANQQAGELSEIMENGAKYYYVRSLSTQEQIDEVNRLVRDHIEISPGRALSPEFPLAIQQRRDDAAYWLGIVSFEQGDYKTAAQYFGPMTLDPFPDGPWSNGARFNLARCNELQGNLAEAIQLYEADKSPQRYGNRLRAARLKEQLPKQRKPEKTNEKPTAASKS